MDTITADTINNLADLTNDELDALADGIPEGTVTVIGIDPGYAYDEVLTERFRIGRRNRVAVLPLVAEAAPANVADLILS